MKIYTIHVSKGDMILIRDNFKATSKKRAYQLAEDKLWNYFRDEGLTNDEIDSVISDCEFEQVSTQDIV